MSTLCSIMNKTLLEKNNIQQITIIYAQGTLNSLFSFHQTVCISVGYEEAAELLQSCGKVICVLSSKFPELALAVFWDFLERELDTSGWESGTLSVSELLGFLALTARELSELLCRLSALFARKGKISQTSKSDKSEKHSSLLLNISSPLRACILRWMYTYSSEFAAAFAETNMSDKRSSPNRSRSISVDSGQIILGRITLISQDAARDLLGKLEALATGTSKRLFLWPTITVMCFLLPSDTKRAVRAISASVRSSVYI
jgi:hypothetical protein